MPLNVLLVDPDAGLANEIRSAFGPLGFSVTALGAGEAAVERCRVEPPDLILLAAELPDMSGFSVCNRLKRALASVPLILYTADATEAAIEAHRATRTHADDYLRKPFEVADLLGRAATLLRADQPPGSPASPSPQGDGGPPALPRTDSGQPPRRPSGPPRPPPRSTAQVPQATAAGGPPPMPGARPAPGRLKAPARAETRRTDPSDVLSEWPRDPAPPKGTPEEKLEYFRERLRARDAFLAKVRDAVAEMKAQASHAESERELLQSDLEAERRRLEEAAQDAAAQTAKIEDLQRQLEESENTRQSLSDVLSETMQDHENSEQQWSARIAAVDGERAKLEAQLAEQAESHARAVAAAEADRADERARLEATRAETEEAHARALQESAAEREKDRAEAAAKLAATEERTAAVETERDGLSAEVKRLEGEVAARTDEIAAVQREAEGNTEAFKARLEEATARADSLAAELTAAGAKISALEDEVGRGAQAHAGFEEDLRAARGEARAYEEKAIAAEHAFQAKEAELAAAVQRVEDLSAALDEGRASFEGTRGELARIEAARAESERRAAHATAQRDQLAREVEVARREIGASREKADAERDRIAKLSSEIQRLAKLEPIAEEAARLRKEVVSLREMVSQRTSAAESSSRAAQSAAAERARAEERLAVEGGRIAAQASRLENELGATRRRLEELERETASREAALRRAAIELEERRKGIAAEAMEAERRHGAEVGRLKAAMVDLERHLEMRARSELQLKKRVQELERAGQARPAAADPAEVAKLKALAAKLTEEVEELKGENDFLNGEVARYVQKNKDLSAKKKR